MFCGNYNKRSKGKPVQNFWFTALFKEWIQSDPPIQRWDHDVYRPSPVPCKVPDLGDVFFFPCFRWVFLKDASKMVILPTKGLGILAARVCFDLQMIPPYSWMISMYIYIYICIRILCAYILPWKKLWISSLPCDMANVKIKFMWPTLKVISLFINYKPIQL